MKTLSIILVIILVILAFGCMILGILVLSRKGGWLFFTMDDDKEKYNIERLRLVWGIVPILAAVALSLYSFLTGWSIMIFASLNFVGIILQETWAKKKDSDS